MTKDDLPPLPDCMPTVNALDQLFRQRHNDDDVIRVLIPVLRQAQLAADALEQASAASQPAQEPTAIAKAYAAGFADGHKAASQPSQGLVRHHETSRFHKALAADLASQPAQQEHERGGVTNTRQLEGGCGSAPNSRVAISTPTSFTSQPAQEPIGKITLHLGQNRVEVTLQQPYRAGFLNCPVYAAPPADTARADRIMELVDDYSKATLEMALQKIHPGDLMRARAALEAEVRKG